MEGNGGMKELRNEGIKKLRNERMKEWKNERMLALIVVEGKE